MIELRTDGEIARAYPVIRQLYPHIRDEGDFLRRVHEGRDREGYRLFALEEGGQVVAACGVQAMFTLYYDHCLWICDLVVDDARRGGGVGGRMMKEIEDWARLNGYREISLNSGAHRLATHRFYVERMGYRMDGLRFNKQL